MAHLNPTTPLRWLALLCGALALPVVAAEPAAPRDRTVVGDSTLTGDTGAHDPTLWVGPSGWHVFSTGPGLQRLHSKDGVHWVRREPIFSAANRPAWWKQTVPAHEGVDVWAPKLFQHNGRFWVMYSISTFGKRQSAIGLASATAPDAPGADWRDDGLVVASTEQDNFNAIDPDVLQAADGRLWLSYGSFWGGIRASELDTRTLRPVGETRFIASHRPGIEAPTLVQRGDWFYLFVSHGYCCRGVDSTYNVKVGRARHPLGPFVDRDGRTLLDNGGTPVTSGGPRWKGPGHQDVFGDTLVFHSYDAQDGGKPHLRSAPLRWSADGWPSM
ncbi:MAG: arabinan endo-1,5-alpha-L-arabinosidase [Rubrivivax sp.]